MSWDISDNESWKYDEIPLGAMTLESATSVETHTGSWRTRRPIWDAEKCKNCLLCWINCPDSSILVENREMVGIDYDHCKGCGVCCVACKFDALHLQNEAEARLQEEEGK